eukprot:115098-Rhodomonas_salina.1
MPKRDSRGHFLKGTCRPPIGPPIGPVASYVAAMQCPGVEAARPASEKAARDAVAEARAPLSSYAMASTEALGIRYAMDTLAREVFETGSRGLTQGVGVAGRGGGGAAEEKTQGTLPPTSSSVPLRPV